MKQIIFSALLILLPMVSNADDSGVCGDGLTYKFDSSTSTLTISKTGEGTGEMKSYSYSYSFPWDSYWESILYVELENGVTTIAPQAFHYLENMKSIKIPQSVFSIGSGAFNGCFNLLSIDIPEGVTSIGGETFKYCKKIVSITIPSSIETIDNQAFFGCESLSSIIIPSGVKYIASSAFWNCPALNSIIVDTDNKVYDSRDGSNTIIETETNKLIVGCKNSTIPNTVNSIEDAFFGCVNLTSLFIPSSVHSITSYSFEQCINLETIVVDPNNTVYDSRNNCNAIIEKSTNKLFLGCKNTIIPNDIKIIGDGSFLYCAGLTTLKIPDSVVSIGSEAFADCKSLTSLDLPGNLQYINSQAFAACSNLMSINIPSSVIYVGLGAFNGTGWHVNQKIGSLYLDGWFLGYRPPYDVIDVKIEEGTKGIAGWIGNTKIIKSICIPKSVRYISGYAFGDCRNLEDVYCYSEIVPEAWNSFGVVSEFDIVSATLHVPAESLDLYKKEMPWRNFVKIVALTDDDPQPASIQTFLKDEATPVAIYTLDGKRIPKLQRGVNILHISDGTTKKLFVK